MHRYFNAALLCLALVGCSFKPPDAGSSGTDGGGAVDGSVTPSVDADTCESTVRRMLTFQNGAQDEDLNDFPVMVRLDSDRIDHGRAAGDGSDLRFVDADNTALAFEIEQWDSSGDSYIWVNVPRIDGSSDTDFIWMYYGGSPSGGGQNPAGTWNANYRGVWHLNGTFDDSTSNGNDGTDGGSSDVAGQFANARSFDGSDDFVDLGSQGSLDDLAEFTYTAWIQPVAVGPQMILSKRGGRREFRIQGQQDDEMHLRGCAEYSGSNRLCATSDQDTISLDQWQMVAMTHDSIGHTGAVYINGIEEDTGTSGGNVDGDGSGDLHIGANSEGGNHFEGIIDEVRVSNVVRSEVWLQAQYLSMLDSFIVFGEDEAVSCQ